mmetsp:Transcript_20346/g.38271  ORF Transcript_20346/g.38271 Transcript_20346/m.38271 type:complete len:81 (+) Transcript_20346:3-245(+)
MEKGDDMGGDEDPRRTGMEELSDNEGSSLPDDHDADDLDRITSGRDGSCNVDGATRIGDARLQTTAENIDEEVAAICDEP